jgi:hypothetical protein
MSVTLKVSDGHIVISATTGVLETVSGNSKASQDLAECLLQEYSSSQNYGSYLKAIITNPNPLEGASELLVRHYVAEAVKLLDAAQLSDPAITSDEKLTQITRLETASDDSGTVGFFVQVATEDGGASVQASAVQATSLNHLTEGF